MFRCSGWSILLLCGFVSSASAEKITVDQALRLSGSDLELQLLDPSFQQAVVSAAPTDWRETNGADVWRVLFEGMNVQVQVFPTLHRPGVGQPNCCVFFEVENTEFWLKIVGLLPTTGSESEAGTASGGEQPDVGGRPAGAGEPPTNPPSSSGAPSVSGQPVSGPPASRPLASGPPAGGPPTSGANPPPVGGGSAGPIGSADSGSVPPVHTDGPATSGEPAPGVVDIVDVPEPSLLLLLGLGVAAAARRVRQKSR
jgi:hypothetical protein